MTVKQKVEVNAGEEEDTSPLLKIDHEELREVNEPAWLVYDGVMAFIATYLTHSSDEMSIPLRLVAVAFILGTCVVLSKLYFTAGLDRPMSGQHPIDKWWHIAIVHAGNAFFFWEWVVSLYRMVLGYYNDPNGGLLKLLIVSSFGFYVALWLCDLIAGVVHWFGDTTEMYFFDYHHRDSRYMTRQSYVHHVWETFGLSLVLSVFVPLFRTNPLFTTVRIVACQSNECHMWAHCTSKEIPPLIKLLQDWTLVLSWKAHKEHHKPPHLIDYCVFNGWANPIMNKILPGPVTKWVETNIRDNPKWKRLKQILDT